MKGFSFFDLLHSYVYGRWTYFYIAMGTGRHPLAKRLAPLLNWIGGPNAILFSALTMTVAAMIWRGIPFRGSLLPAAVAGILVVLILANHSGRLIDVIYAKGVLRDWWTDEDNKRFEARAGALVQQYNAFSPIPGMNVNGQLTLGENIGDLSVQDCTGAARTSFWGMWRLKFVQP